MFHPVLFVTYPFIGQSHAPAAAARSTFEPCPKYGTVCLKHYELVDEDVQKAYMAHQKVLAGHFLWGENFVF